MENLKYENFNKGGDMRETIAQFMHEKANQFYDNGYTKYNSRKETDENKSNSERVTSIYNVDKSGQQTDRADAKRQAAAMLEKGTEYGGQFKYINDGKGNTQVYFEVQDQATGDVTWKFKEKISTNEAIKFRGLGGLGYSMDEPAPSHDYDGDGVDDQGPVRPIDFELYEPETGDGSVDKPFAVEKGKKPVKGKYYKLDNGEIRLSTRNGWGDPIN
jgi:hypothetical protein